MVDITAAALYMNFFGKYVPWIAAVPQWAWALAALVTVLAVNLVSVKVFGELEFWFALIKVTALVAFLLVGIYFVIFGTPTGAPTGFSLIADNGGFFPNGILPAIILMQGVVFAYASIELVGTAAGETKDPEKVMPRAINSVIFRVAIFYVGSVLLLALLLPFTAYSKDESPFVTFFGSIGVPGVDVIMNLVVLTAALSSLNAGLYSTGRILRSMAVAGSAPKFASRMNKAGVPYGGIAITAVVALLGVVINYVNPSDAFETVLNVAAKTMVIADVHKRLADRGELVRPKFRLFWAPYTGYATLVFLAIVLVLVFIDSPATLVVAIIASLLITAGWFVCRKRIAELAAEREGYTGTVPVVPSPFPQPREKKARGTKD